MLMVDEILVNYIIYIKNNGKKRLLMMGKSGNWFMSSINIINVRRWSFWIHLDGSRSTSSTLPRRLAVLGKLSLRKH